MNTWFTDIDAVRVLLNYKNFQSEVCQHNNFWFSSIRDIEFITRKSSRKLPSKGIFTPHSSYFNAVRNLPITGKAFPFFVDRLFSLREVSKLALFASGAISLTQRWFNFDASLATYTAVGSIAAWFFSNQLVSTLEPKVKDYIKQARSINYQNHPLIPQFKRAMRDIQNHPEIQKVLNPGPPPKPEDMMRALLQQLGIDPSQIEVFEKLAD